MWPMRRRHTFERVISTPQRAQMIPSNQTRLYVPQDSQSRVGPKIHSQNRPSFSGFSVR